MAARRRSEPPLTPSLDRFVDSLVRSGRYASRAEVLDEAVRLMQEHEAVRRAHVERLRQDVDEGLRALAAGEVSDFNETAVGRIRAKGRRMLEARRRPVRRKAS